MAVTLYPVTPNFAAEVGDIDLSGRIDPADLLAIKEAFAKYAVLIFPDQHLSQSQHLAFARHFGPLEATIATYRKEAPLRLPQELTDVSNLDADNEIWAKKPGGGSFSWALGCGILTTPSNVCRRACRCSTRAAYRLSGGIPNSPTSAQLMMRFPRRSSAD